MTDWKKAEGFPPLGRKLRILLSPANKGGCAYYRVISPFQKLGELYPNVVELRYNENPLGVDVKNQRWEPDWDWSDMKWADIIVTNNITNFGGPYTARIIGKAKEFGVKAWYDTDDLLTELYDGHRLKEVYDGGLSDLTKFIYGHADIVTVTQRKFAERIKPYIGQGILAVVKNCIDYNLPCWRSPKYIKPKKNFVRIGWAGGIHHEEDVKEFAAIPHLVNQKVGRENVSWDFYGRPPKDPSGKEDWQQDVWDNYQKTLLRGFRGPINCNFYPAMPSDQYGVMYANMDIAIAPLQMNAFNDSKSEIKVAECGRYKVPLIASNVGCYDETIINGETGYLIEPNASRAEWVNILTKVIKNHKHRERMGENLHSITDQYFDLNKVVHNRLDLLEQVYQMREWIPKEDRELEVIEVQSNPKINILTRTCDRPEFFQEHRKSIEDQSYDNWNHLISADGEQARNYTEGYGALHVSSVERRDFQHFPYNLYCNELTAKVEDGWIMYLDDDDLFVGNESLKMLVDELEDENTLHIFRCEFPDRTIPGGTFGIAPTYEDIVSCSWAVHSRHKHLINWKDEKGADFKVVEKLAKHLKIKWIDKVLTKINYDRGWGGSGLKKDKGQLNTVIEDGEMIFEEVNGTKTS